MKIVILNGSPRKGNTFTAINAFVKGIAGKHEVEVIETDKLNLIPCKGCNVCEMHKGCVSKDDTNATVDKLVAADMIVFTTPVYWWGMTAQLKLMVDKCYCKGALLKGKKIGVIVVGGSPTDHEQYDIIYRQFACMTEYLSWNMEFYKSYYANAKDDLANDAAAIAELEKIGEQL